MEEKIIGYFCSKHGFYKEEPFICSVCWKESESHRVSGEPPKMTSKRYDNIHIYVNKMKDVTQRNAIQMLEQGY